MSATVAPLVLAPPQEGRAELEHDGAFGTWDMAFSVLRTTVNTGVDALNRLGAGLPRLPEGSLEELLVEPLTGDYRAIRANAAACHEVRDGCLHVAGQLARVGVRTGQQWQGLAGAAFVLRTEACAAGTAAVGTLVRHGSVVLDEVADLSEQLGIRVERLVVRLGQLMASLVRKILARVAGPVGAAVLAADVLTQGLGAVTDIIDDIVTVVAMVQDLLALRDEARAWCEQQEERLRVLDALTTTLGEHLRSALSRLSSAGGEAGAW